MIEEDGGFGEDGGRGEPGLTGGEGNQSERRGPKSELVKI